MATEAQLRSIWQDKLQRFSGNEEHGEEKLALFSQVWDAVLPRLQPKDSLEYLKLDDDGDAQAYRSLTDKDVMRTACINAFDAMRQRKELLRNVINQYTDQWQASGDINDFIPVFTQLSQWRSLWLRPFALSSGTIPEELLAGFNTILFLVLPTTFPEALTDIFEATLDQPILDCEPLFQLLASFGIIRNFETLICRVSYRAIERKIAETCPEKWDEPCLKEIQEWVQKVLAPRSAHVYSFDPEMKMATYAGDHSISQKFEFHVYKTLCELRISELFKIISSVEPDAVVLQDLKACVSRVSARGDVIRSLRQQITKRLLHPGAETSDIIGFYISMIRCLKVIDPQGVLLYRVADPIRSYLRLRPDTIRHIVTQLINEKSELAQEATAPIVAEMEHEDYSDPHWQPEPPEAGPKFRTMRPTDLISTLVGIYDSHELFTKELQVLFSNILLQSREGNFDAEKRQIEILKLRFGDPALQGPDVMLTDMQTSTRVNRLIYEGQPDPIMKPAVISRWFWPSPPDVDKFKMPGQFAELQEAYAKKYGEQKPDKRLHWVHQMGSLTISIELKDRTLPSITVSPLEAAVIELFSQSPRWSQSALIEKLGVKEKTIIPVLIAWSERGVLKYNDHFRHWILIEERDAVTTSAYIPMPAMTDVGSPPNRGDDLDQQHWQYIKAMLTNFGGGLSTSVIHNMLKYAPERKTSEQLEALLKRLESENLIEGIDGVWRLV